MADRSPVRFVGPIVTVVVGLVVAAASSRLALGPGVADVEQPVARAVFLAAPIVAFAGGLWGIHLRSRHKP